MDKLDGKSKDIVKDNIEKLKNIFPEIVTEGKIDFDNLKETLGNYVDDREERYNFTWNGKSQAKRIAQTPSTGTLRFCKEESVNWYETGNLFIEGDNLEVLKLLQKSYHKKVKMIYIDPPYNTGNDFIYKDNYKDNIANYLEVTGQVDSEGKKLSVNPETSGRYHTDWLNMMYPRLKLAKNLLKDDGVIVASFDENEIVNIRKIFDEVFGESNLLFQITLLCNPKGRSQDKFVANCHEYLVGYSKQQLNKGDVNISKSDEEITKNYKLKDERGRYRELELRNTHREFGEHNRQNLYYPFYISRSGQVSLVAVPGTIPVYPNWDDGFKGCWTWGADKALNQLDEIVAKKVKGSWKIYRKNYAEGDNSKPTKQVKSIWTEKQFHTEKGQATFNELFKTKNKIFQSPKSVDTIRQLLLMTTAKESIILDFFSGSATTAHAVIQLNVDDGCNRKFIMIQLPEHCDKKSEAFKAGYKTISDIGKERICRVIKKIKSEQAEQKKKNKETLFNENKPDNEKELDLGFKVFKLDSSNIKTWDSDFENLEKNLFDSIDNIKSDRSTEDVLYEILLKYGLDLTVSIEERTIANEKVYSIGSGALIICLEKDISNDVIEGIIELKEELKPEIIRVVFSDASFKDDSAKTNAINNLKQNGIEDIRSI